MPANNVEMIKIWKIAHEYLRKLSDAYKSRGQSSMSMTLIASQAILNLPMPNGSHPVSQPAEHGETQSEE